MNVALIDCFMYVISLFATFHWTKSNLFCFILHDFVSTDLTALYRCVLVPLILCFNCSCLEVEWSLCIFYCSFKSWSYDALFSYIFAKGAPKMWVHTVTLAVHVCVFWCSVMRFFILMLFRCNFISICKSQFFWSRQSLCDVRKLFAQGKMKKGG